MGKTRTSTTGKRTDRGYTLIELSLVVLLIGLMLFIAAPRVRDTLLNDRLKAAARQLTGAARELRAEAVREQVDYILHFDLNGQFYWTYTADMTPEKRQERKQDALRFPDPVKVADFCRIGRKKQTDGEATVTFFRKGYVQPVILHLADGDRFFTLFFSPFRSEVTSREGYVEERELVHSVAY